MLSIKEEEMKSNAICHDEDSVSFQRQALTHKIQLVSIPNITEYGGRYKKNNIPIIGSKCL